MGRRGRRSRLAAAALAVLAGLGILSGVPFAVAPAGAEVMSPTAVRSVTDARLLNPAGSEQLLATPDGQRLINATMAYLQLYSPSGELLAEQRSSYPDWTFGPIWLSPDGSTVYTWIYSRNEIWRYDARTLALKDQHPAPACAPYGTLAVTATRLWFSDPCHQGLMSADLALATDAVPAPTSQQQYPGGAHLLGMGGALIVEGGTAIPNPDPWAPYGYVLDRLEVRGTDVERAARVSGGPTGWIRPEHLSADPSGRTVLTGQIVRDARTLAPLAGHATNPHWDEDDAVVVRDGAHVLSATEWRTDTVGLWDVTRRQPVWWIGAGKHNGWYSPTIATNGDGSVAFVFDEDRILTIRFGEELARLSLDPAADNDDTTVDGRLALSDGTSPLAQVVLVERVGLGGAVPVGVGVPGVDGRFSVPDPAGPGVANATYRARWAGDARHPGGSLALLLAKEGAVRTAPRAEVADVDLEIRSAVPQQLVVDEAHRRLVVRASGWNATETQSTDRIDVYGLDGTFHGTLPTTGEPVDVVLTPDQSHLLVLERTEHQVEVFDAASLARVGSIDTEPWVLDPRRIYVLGDDLWMQSTDASVVAPLRAPTEAIRSGLTGTGYVPDNVVPDAVTGFAYGTGFSDVRRLDARGATAAPDGGGVTTVATSVGAPDYGPLIAPASPGAPVRIATLDELVDLDHDTLAVLQRRTPPEHESVNLQGGVAGPRADQVLILASVWDDHAQAVVWVYDAGSQPYRAFTFDRSSPYLVGATPSGSAAFVLTGSGSSDHPNAVTYRLAVRRDPYARCAVTLDPLPAILTGLSPVTVSGQVQVPAGASLPAQVQLSLAGGSASVAVGGDGRFTGSVVPALVGATLAEVAVPQGDVGGCRAQAPLELRAAPTTPDPDPTPEPDPDPGPTAPVPFATVDGFVARQVRDVLGIDSPAATTSALAAIVADGSVTPDQLTAWLIAISDPIEGALARLYLTALGRWPTASEVAARVADLVGGTSMAQIATTLGRSSAFRTRFGTGSDDAFVTSLYRTTLHRGPSAGERRARLAELARGDSRGLLAFRLAQTSEVAVAVGPYLQVELAYLALLHRNTTADEMAAARHALDTGTPYTDLLEDLRTSAVYAQRIAALGSGS